MADDIEVRYEPQHGFLELSCGDEVFSRVREAVIAAAGLEDARIDGAAASIRIMQVEHFAAAKPPSRLRDGLALWGCGLVTFAILFVMSVGLATIAGWLR